MTDGPCPFCARIASRDFEICSLDVVTFEPLNPVTPGHRLFVPVRHTRDFLHGRGAETLGRVMEHAATWHSRWGSHLDANLIVSAGPDATQTVPHLHVHLVPRRPDDGLHLPWTGQPIPGAPMPAA